jgi:hypothetical protein
MSDDPIRMPEELRRTVERDLEPVRPLPPPWKRLLFVLPVAAVALLLPLGAFNIRGDSQFDLLLGWIPVAIQLLLAGGLLLFALRESVPGWRVSSSAVFLLCLMAFGLQVIVNLAIYLRMPMPGEAERTLSMWFACFRFESLIGLPILVVNAWLVARALPQRPWLAGLLAGLGAGFAADASWRLICPASDPGHVLLGHTGGILLLGVTGFLLGYLWSLFEARAPRS